jgi:hypothetical protein
MGPSFTSPAKSERTTAVLGVALGLLFGVCLLTGLLSHLIQQPPGWFAWPSRPVWLYRWTQGLHVFAGSSRSRCCWLGSGRSIRT